MITSVWNGIVSTLETAKEQIGVVQVERSEMGLAASTRAPGLLVWMDLSNARSVRDQTGLVFLVVPIHVGCISQPAKSSSEALDSAIEIATEVINTICGTTIAECFVELLEDASPIETVYAKSEAAVVAVNLQAKVSLTSEEEE